MLPQTITVSAPTRLHFGLLSFGNPDVRQFGGVGVMINGPRLRLTAEPSAKLEVVGPLAERVRSFLHDWMQWYRQADEPPWRIQIDAEVRQHTGLGVGTQLGLATATLLCLTQRWPLPTVDELAETVRRGRRSAVGTHGFAWGGLISEPGKVLGERVSPLQARVPLPASWRFLLVTPRLPEGASGCQESQLFSQLPAVPAAVTAQLIRILGEQILPAAQAANCRLFGEAVYQYGRLAGDCFATVQGGPYNGERLERLVSTIRKLGVTGVGQSSWGPTIFAVLESKEQADWLRTQLDRLGQLDNAEHCLASPNNSGAVVSLYQAKRKCPAR